MTLYLFLIYMLLSEDVTYAEAEGGAQGHVQQHPAGQEVEP